MNKHLTIKERYHIWSLYGNGKSNGQISKEIRKHKTTVSIPLANEKERRFD